MKCPHCGNTESKVVDSRPASNDEKIRRRRECLNCGARFTTFEMIETAPLMVVKKDGSRELFDSNKLLAGMVRACEKRPVSLETLETASYEIEMSLKNSCDGEVPSTKIGEAAMMKLKEIDEVAYVRFASVYRQFKDITSFMDELEKLILKSDKPAETQKS